MGKLTSSEARSLHAWRNKGKSGAIVAGHLVTRGATPSAPVETLSKQQLTILIENLPKGKTVKVHSPILYRIRSKLKAELARKGGAEPHHGSAESWPKIFRMMSHINLARAGLHDAGMGQIARYNEKGLKIPSLRGTQVWRSKSSGDLVIIGTWSQVSGAIAGGGTGLKFRYGAGDSREGAVDYDFDRKYGSQWGESDSDVARTAKMTLCVEVSSGIGVTETDDDYEVVLNAPGEIVKAVGNKITGIAGAAGPESLGHAVLDKISEVKGAIEDHVIPIGEKIEEIHSARREAKIHKTHLTVRIGIGASGSNYKDMGEEFTGAELSRAVNELRGGA